jgi:tetratricopeptide (TPR) repeat protein
MMVCCFYFFPNNSFAQGDERKGKMWRAQDYFKVKMYGDAINELRKIIDESPTNASAHLLLGDCFLATNQPQMAGVSYERYLILKPGNGKEIAPKLMQIGNIMLVNNQLSEANKNYIQAVNSFPSLRIQIADFIFQRAKTFLYNKELEMANILFRLASSYNPRADINAGRVKQEFGRSLLAEAKIRPRNERERYLFIARKLVEPEEVQKLFPPPRWVSVFKKEYTGNGLEKNDIIPGLPILLKDILKEDKIIIKGTKFKFLNGPWQEYSGGMETICGNPDEPGPIEVLAPKGEKIFVEVQRLVD